MAILKFKGLPVKLLLLLASFVIGLTLLEFALWVFFPVYDPRGTLQSMHYFEGDVILARKNFVGRMWKNTGDFNVPVRINKYGFRDKKDLVHSTPDELFVLGDSFGMGWGVEEEKRFSNLLELMLETPVYNISSPAGNMNNYRRLLDYARRKGAKIDNLIISVCMENDIGDYDRPLKTARKVKESSKGRVSRKKPRPGFYGRLSGARMWLKRNSAIYQALASIIHQNAALKEIAVKHGLIMDNYANVRGNKFSTKVISSTAERILDLSHLFNTTIVLIPSRALWVGQNRGEELDVHNALIGLLLDAEANVIDLRPHFEKGGKPLQYYFRNDGHWNENGHLKAAEVIAGYFNQEPLYSVLESNYNQ